MMNLELNSFMLVATETHLKQEIKDAEIYIDGFILYRADRKNRPKGGVAIYLRKDIAHHTTMIDSGSNEYVEYIILHNNKLNLVVAAVYSPPGVPNDKLFDVMNRIQEQYNEIGQPSPSLIVCGDFNMPQIDWQNSDLEEGGAVKQYMLRFRDDLFLTQLISAPTRNNNILDLCFVNNEDLIINTEFRPTNLTDHNLVVIETALEYKEMDNKTPKIQEGFNGEKGCPNGALM